MFYHITHCFRARLSFLWSALVSMVKHHGLPMLESWSKL